MTKNEAQQKTYANVVKGKVFPSKKRLKVNQYEIKDHKRKASGELYYQDDLLRGIKTIFLGVSYSCNNFGHKVVNCKAYARDRSYSRNEYCRIS